MKNKIKQGYVLMIGSQPFMVIKYYETRDDCTFRKN